MFGHAKGSLMIQGHATSQIAILMGPTWGTPGSCRPHVGPMNLLSGLKPKPYEAHDDIMTWKQFPNYWPFVQGVHWSSVEFFYLSHGHHDAQVTSLKIVHVQTILNIIHIVCTLLCFVVLRYQLIFLIFFKSPFHELFFPSYFKFGGKLILV